MIAKVFFILIIFIVIKPFCEPLCMDASALVLFYQHTADFPHQNIFPIFLHTVVFCISGQPVSFSIAKNEIENVCICVRLCSNSGSVRKASFYFMCTVFTLSVAGTDGLLLGY